MSDIVLVEWDDAYVGTSAWYEQDEIDQIGSQKLMIVHVGWLLRCTDHYLVIAGGVNVYGGDCTYTNLHRIPITWIGKFVKIGELNTGDKKCIKYSEAKKKISEWKEKIR